MAAYLSHSAGSCAILTRAAIGCLTVEFLFTFILLQGCRGSSRSHRAMRWCRISSRWIGVLAAVGAHTGIPPGMVIFLLLVMYIILGSIFETVAAMIITLPVVFPLVVGLGFDPIWWGIINIMVIEIGQTTPPIGIIPFVLHGMRPDISLKTIFIGIVPFFFADLTRLGIIAAFPALALWLPDRLGMLLN